MTPQRLAFLVIRAPWVLVCWAIVACMWALWAVQYLLIIPFLPILAVVVIYKRLTGSTTPTLDIAPPPSAEQRASEERVESR